MGSLDKLREQIDRLDLEIVNLLNKRAELVIKVGKVKKETEVNFHALDREEAIYERLSKINQGVFPKEAIVAVFREIISTCLSLQRPLSVAYLGPEATFTHLASIQQFGQSANFTQKRNIAEIFEEVERDRADYGVVPVENSTEGVIHHTLDMFIDTDLKIHAETLLQISHHLLSKTGRIEDVKKIYSHPQAISQCSKWLSDNLGHLPAEETSSTAMAARLASLDSQVAAIASEFASKVYNLKIVKREIEDNINNFTRFWVVGKKLPPRTGRDKTSIMFVIKDEVGALYRTLEPFAHYNINLTKIESHPFKKRAWEYIFFLDMEGHLTDSNIESALEKLKKGTLFLKVLGSYPRSR